MATVNIEETLRASISGLSIGDAVNSFTGYLATLFVYELPFNGERLSDVGKIKIAVELGGQPPSSTAILIFPTPDRRSPLNGSS